MKNSISVHTLDLESEDMIDDPDYFLIHNRDSISKILQEELKAKKQFKYKLDINVNFYREVDGESDFVAAWFGPAYSTVLHLKDIEQSLDFVIPDALERVRDYNTNGSGWHIFSTLKIVIKVVQYSPLSGGCMGDAPSWVKNSKSVTNIVCAKNDCFPIHVLFKLLKPDKHDSRRTYKQLEKNMHLLDMTNISLPVPLDQINRFESQNPQISVNVYYSATVKRDGCSIPKLYPIRVSKKEASIPVDLLILPHKGERQNLEKMLFDTDVTSFEEGGGEEAGSFLTDGLKQRKKTGFHYCLINNLSRLLRPAKQTNRRIFVCRKCLLTFRNENVFNTHDSLCSPDNPQVCNMPKEHNKFLQFSKPSARLKPWFTIYGDFECILSKTQLDENTDMGKSSTTTLQNHTPFAYAYIVLDHTGQVVRRCSPRIFRDSFANVAAEFLREIDELYCKVLLPRMKERGIHMTEEEKLKHYAATHCEICGRRFNSTVLKVAHHDHKTSRYLATICDRDNLEIRQTKKVPVIFHSSASYDTHLLMGGLAEVADKSDRIMVIPRTKEKYVGFSWKCLTFLDSLSFLNSSLDTLAKGLSSSELRYLHQHFKDDPMREIKIQLLSKKGFFPYSFLDSSERLSLKTLPPRSEFFNDLTQEELSPEDYEHACQVFKVFKCRNLGDYAAVYLACDVLLLSCVFEAFRSMAFDCYKIEPTAFYSLPGFSLQAALLMCNAKVELLTDREMLLMVNGAIRGGMTVCSHRYSKANNKDLADFDPGKPSTYITAWDANGMYALAQKGALPTGNFRWLETEELDNIDVFQLSPLDKTGYFFEVELTVPDDPAIHEYLSDFPPAPVLKKVNIDDLSPYQQNHWNRPAQMQEKLILDLTDKQKYVLHYLTLRCYAELGIKFVIKRGISFSQDNWLSPYIDFNTGMRQKATTSFAKSLFKLLLNSLFGKLMERKELRRRVVLAVGKKSVVRYASKPSFYDFTVIKPNFVAIELKQTSVTLDVPFICGATVLEISKCFMYSMFYKVIRPSFQNPPRLQYMDTDCFVLLIESDDLIKELKPLAKHIFDFSNLSPNHELYDRSNALKLGLLKDEVAGQTISEFIGLKSKMYYIKTSESEKKIGKGIHRSALRSQVTRDHYFNAVFNKQSSPYRVHFTTFKTDGKHNIQTVKQVKLSVNNYCDKRKFEDDLIHCTPFGFKGDASRIRMPCF
ncbi:uncharacterized protein LOC117648370 [Thrips palmi]|uniref:DNA-directed DNA polymerase n=1 Tax=Thrips palmi TaxID=161013 RepID=A0A6P8Z2P9_THRPL|nr:uncharacterized protein LOC117648370 [Thrips palmi]